jgi:hypothetical protein
MSDELKTGEQALAEGRGKIELPEPIGATVIEHSEDGTATVTHLPVEEEPVFEDSAIVDRVPVEAPLDVTAEPATAAPEPPKKNTLGTQDFCPMKDKCNHRSEDYCKQAKLEADHRRNCIKGYKCDCFHPARGIPQTFRVTGGGDGRIS